MCNHFTGCSLQELWNLPAAVDIVFLPNVNSLGDAAANYPNCDDRSVGSVVLKNTTLNTATVAYITSGSIACFVCDEKSGYELNTTTNERDCQRDGTWDKSSTICGRILIKFMMYQFATEQRLSLYVCMLLKYVL